MPKSNEQKFVSADGHVMEPANLWVERMDRRFRDRAPHIVTKTLQLRQARGIRRLSDRWTQFGRFHRHDRNDGERKGRRQGDRESRSQLDCRFVPARPIRSRVWPIRTSTTSAPRSSTPTAACISWRRRTWSIGANASEHRADGTPIIAGESAPQSWPKRERAASRSGLS